MRTASNQVELIVLSCTRDVGPNLCHAPTPPQAAHAGRTHKVLHSHTSRASSSHQPKHRRHPKQGELFPSLPRVGATTPAVTHCGGDPGRETAKPGWSTRGRAELAQLLALPTPAAVMLKGTYIVGLDYQLDDILGVLVQNLHRGPRNQGGEVLEKTRSRKKSVLRHATKAKLPQERAGRMSSAPSPAGQQQNCHRLAARLALLAQLRSIQSFPKA